MRRGHILLVTALAAVIAAPQGASARHHFPGGMLGAAALPLQMVMGAAGLRMGRYHRSRLAAIRRHHRGAAAMASTGSAASTASRGDTAAERPPAAERRPASWAGPLFWPNAYDDLIAYTFWPSNGGERFLAHGFGDIADAMFIAARESADGSGRHGKAARRSSQDRARETANKPAVDICVSRQAGDSPDGAKEKIADATIARIGDMVQPNEAQRSALDELRTALINEIDGMRASCPAADAFFGPRERLDAMGRRVWTILQAATALRAPAEKFYNTLNDEQKARLNGDSSAATRACFEQAQAQAQAGASAAGQIEKSLQPTRDQRTGLETLKGTSSNMAKLLVGSCPREAPATPAARLGSAQDRLNAILYAVRIVSPAFNTFYDTLSDEQKARFKATGQPRAAQADTY